MICERSKSFLDTFGRVYLASGVKGIDGEGYWYDRWYRAIPGYNWKGATFIAKTVTLEARDGNLPLKENLQPKQHFPKCVKVYPFRGAMMNAVGVSSPGLQAVLDSGVWYTRTKPFLISLIPVKHSSADRISEMEACAQLIQANLDKFQTQIGLQLNISCPNVHIDFEMHMEDVTKCIEILKKTGLPLDLKVSVGFPAPLVRRIANMHNLECVTCSNTIPYGWFKTRINWENYNHLVDLGGGGLSGKPLLPFVLDWIREYTSSVWSGVAVKGCGGIMSKEDVASMERVGAKAVELGTVKLLRPWRVRGIIKEAERVFECNW